MIFGWQGFAIEHPDDWAPVQLTGNRDEGYVRIASPSRLACQLRWKKAPSGDNLTERLRQYLSRLERDAKRARNPFDADLETEGSRITYRYHGATHGRGALFFSPESERVFFLELISPKNESMLTAYRQLVDSFRCEMMDRWALLGLDVRLPRGLKVEKTVLEAGHIRLDLRGRGVSARAERWGFGEQLVAKHGLEPWAREALPLRNACLLSEDRELLAASYEQKGTTSATNAERLRFERRGLSPTHALVLLQPESNQIISVVVRSRKKEWWPQWDWIA